MDVQSSPLPLPHTDWPAGLTLRLDDAELLHMATHGDAPDDVVLHLATAGVHGELVKGEPPAEGFVGPFALRCVKATRLPGHDHDEAVPAGIRGGALTLHPNRGQRLQAWPLLSRLAPPEGHALVLELSLRPAGTIRLLCEALEPVVLPQSRVRVSWAC